MLRVHCTRKIHKLYYAYELDIVDILTDNRILRLHKLYYAYELDIVDILTDNRILKLTANYIISVMNERR